MAFGLLKVLDYCSFGLYLYLECVLGEEDVLDKVIVFQEDLKEKETVG